MNDQPATLFAPAPRAPQSEIARQTGAFAAVQYAGDILEAMSQVALLFNRDRQIVYANHVMLAALGINNCDSLLGQRPGEALNCVHAGEMAGGCGTSEACRLCGAIGAILAAQQTGKPATSECRLSVQQADGIAALDLRVTASPLPLAGEDFILVTLLDISDEKRRLMLERIFFHDLINTATAIDGLVSVIMQQDCEPASTRQIMPLVNRSAQQLVEEIIAQRQLTQAEHGELKIQCADVATRPFLDEIAATYAHHAISRGRTLQVADDTLAATIATDPVLLRRVVGNLIKNALEATAPGGAVTVSGRATATRYVFAVHNPDVMAREVQLQVFQRSFSTKGHNRGLGTYSIKLLVERYLGGRVSFTSDEARGTVFMVDLPAQMPAA